MKKNILYTMLFVAAAFVMVSCGDDDSAGKSRITYYPTIELTGGSYYVADKGSTWEDPGYTSIMGGEDVSDQVTISGNVDTSKPGLYTLTYTTAKNEDGFGASTTRTVIVADPNDPVEGLYWNSSDSYRIRQGAEVKYGNEYPVVVLSNGDGTYDVDDMLGGWYCYRAGYGSDYAMGATISVADGTVTLEDGYVPGWDDGPDEGFEGTFDAATGTFTLTTKYANMDFVQTWVKQVKE
ncbi:MAG: DUF5012 domain-containing protein [Bacteroidaceae bacterium]|nr:DUF5012 domain-containing protein [Bacteroidaceae bacterium]MBO4593802.1 DUF5012 domain-containing protein [Bacteroidaceae bacterium]MBR4782311.1 DUF5012 domain-containing protein [Bacteroidaceae bacterium]